MAGSRWGGFARGGVSLPGCAGACSRRKAQWPPGGRCGRALGHRRADEHRAVARCQPTEGGQGSAQWCEWWSGLCPNPKMLRGMDVHVTGICSSKNEPLVRRLGAQEVRIIWH